MSERAKALGDRFEHASHELIAAVQRMSDEDWRAQTAAEGWTVGVATHHVAVGHKQIAGLVQTIASGQPVPALTMDMFAKANAAHAKEHAHCTKVETLDLLRKNCAAAVATVRGLSDAQLERSATVMGGTMSAAQAIERILIGHVQDHFGSIKRTLGWP